MKNLFKKITLFFFLVLAGSSAFSESTLFLGSGDVVRVSVYEHPDLDIVARISENGTINFPLVGEIQIGGMDERDAEATIELLLHQGEFVKSPQVTLLAERYSSRQVSVLGKVKNPGKYSLAEGNTVVDIIALAGGITSEGSDKVILSRFGKEGLRRQIDLNGVLRDGELKQDWSLMPNDVVFVPRMEVFYIYGEVQRPGVYRLEKGLTVMQAVSIGGSLTDRGTLRGIGIQRRMDGGEIKSVEVQLNDKVMAGDVITVEESLF